MSIVQWNIRSIFKNREQIRLLFRETNAHIICLQETKLGQSTFNPGFNYHFYSSVPIRGVRAQGGSGFVVRKSINHRSVFLRTPSQACAIQVFTSKWVTLCSLYLEPLLERRLVDHSGHPRPLTVDDLQQLIDQLPQPFILMGDFNAKHTLWGETSCDPWGILVEQLIDQNNLVILNDGSPTRHDIYHNTLSAIDLSICSPSVALDYQWSVNADKHGSDHWPIHLTLVQNLPSSCLPKWKISEADWQSYTHHAVISSKCSDFGSPVEAYTHFKDFVTEKASDHIPRTSGNPNRPVVPWWNKDCAVSRRITRACDHRFNRYPCMANRIALSRARARQNRIFKEARRKSFIGYTSEINSKSPPSQVWSKVRKFQGKFIPSPLPVLRIGNSTFSNPEDVAEKFGVHFSSTSSQKHYSAQFQQFSENTLVVPPFSRNTETYNLPFSFQEMEHAVSVSSPTSPGDDGIHYSMISYLPRRSKKFLLEIFNGLWKSNTSPESWKISTIVPILKPGKDPHVPQNYRPIALTSCVCKLYERMINNRLVWYLESRGLLSNRQFGFRKFRSTMDPLLMISREIQNALAVRNQTIAVFFDLEKAYDTTWRKGILKQMADWGIGGNMFHCIKDFLSDRFLKVRVGSSFSSLYPQEEGVPQGSVLSVTLFSIAINSLIDSIPVGIQGLMYADDYAIYCSSSTAVEACRKIQVAINSASTWAKSRGFKFSPSKTKAIRFSRLRRQEEIPTLFLDQTILPYEVEIKYLVIIFDEKLTFKSHIHSVATNVKLRLNVLKVLSHFTWGADRTSLLRIYKALCLSKIEYGCQIYGSACKTTLDILDVVHNMVLRICTGAYRTSPVESLYVDSGIPPLSIRREELGLRLISHVLSSKLNPNYKYVRSPVDRAPNSPRISKPLEVRLATDAAEVGLLPSPIAEVRVPKFPPWCIPTVEVCPVLFYRNDRSAAEMRSEFLSHCFSHKNQTSIFTDGSKTSDGVGCAAILNDKVLKKKLPGKFSVYAAELFSILMVLRYIFNNDLPHRNFVIYTDCRSILASIKKIYPSHHLVQEVQDWLILLHTRRRVRIKFCWVPAHVGIQGNEQADGAAKDATRLGSHVSLGVSQADFAKTLHSYVYNKWQARWSSLVLNKLQAIHPGVLPWTPYNDDRRSGIILTRLRIGHTRLTHRHLLASGNERRPPICPTCHSTVTVKHFLTECPLFIRERRGFNLEGKPLVEILGEDAPVQTLMKFLKAIGIFYDI